MNLILEVVARDGQPSGLERRKVFGVEGGRIGRAADCEWVLSSPYISRYHAYVCCIDDVFYVVRTGGNGVALNAVEAMLPKLEHQALKSGDRLFIDEYEIAVAVSGPARAEQSDPHSAPEPGSPVNTEPVAVAAASDLPGAAATVDARNDIASEELLTATAPSLQTAFGLDPQRNFATPAEPVRRPQVPGAAWNHSSGLADHFIPPPLTSIQASLPADWDETNLPASPVPPEPTPSVLPTRPQQIPTVSASDRSRVPPPDAAARQDNTGAPPIGGSDDVFDLSTFLRGAGIEPGSLSPEMAGMLGSLLRSLIQGLIQALHARAEFHGQFRLPAGRIRIAENNPLKFAADADDALPSLLRRRTDRHLGPLEAVDDAFDEIRKHPQAAIAGMRAGFDSMLDRFDPRKLAQEFDKRARSRALWPMPPAMRYWRQYEDLFETLAGDADSAFRRLFSEPFAQAYERHMKAEGSP